MMAGFAAAGIVIAGGLLGWFFIPWASDATLKRVRRRSDAWWSDSLQAYGVFKRESLGKEPKSEAPGTEGALGIWRDEACSEALAGRLSCERLDAMQKVGIKVEGLLAYGLEKERLDRYSFYASGKQRALFAISLSLLFAVVALSVPNAIAQGALNTCVLAMTIALVCDLRARTIPLETCLVIALFGGIFQASLQGVEGVITGAFFALAVVAGSSFSNRVLKARCPGGAIGRGDMRCMGALALATGSAALGGFAACYAIAGISSLAGCAMKRLTWTSGIPMAPFLAIWLVTGSAACLL